MIKIETHNSIASPLHAHLASEKPLTNFLGLDRKALEDFFIAMGEKKFRATQIMKWVHQMGVADFQAMNNISKSLRDKLSSCCQIKNLTVIQDHLSTDGTRKWVLGLSDNNLIEMVYIPENDRGTLCVSSQAGCALDCSFCSTGRQGFNRNLSSAEIISQVWLATQLLTDEKKPGRKVTNVVMMGMGEPLLNFDNVLTAIKIMMDDFAYGLSKRRVTVSTAGVVPAIDKLGDVIDTRLAVSLHAPNDALRNGLVPLNKKYPLKQLIASCERFIKKQNVRSRITIEYIMLDGINDQTIHAKQLIKLLKNLPTLVNLIPFNHFENSGYTRSPARVVSTFKEQLQQAGITTVIRKTRGKDIDAACGQLAGKIEDKSRRNRRFETPRFGMNDNNA